MRLVLGGDDSVAEFMSAKLGVSFHPPYVAMGVIDDQGVLIGGVLFNAYNGANIEMSVYGPGLLRRRFIRAALDYPFVQLNCLRLSARTKRSNKTTCRMLSKFGFVYEGTLKQYFGPKRGDDAILYVLPAKDAAKWLKAD